MAWAAGGHEAAADGLRAARARPDRGCARRPRRGARHSAPTPMQNLARARCAASRPQRREPLGAGFSDPARLDDLDAPRRRRPAPAASARATASARAWTGRRGPGRAGLRLDHSADQWLPSAVPGAADVKVPAPDPARRLRAARHRSGPDPGPSREQPDQPAAGRQVGPVHARRGAAQLDLVALHALVAQRGRGRPITVPSRRSSAAPKARPRRGSRPTACTEPTSPMLTL